MIAICVTDYALAHLVRLIKLWTVEIGPYDVSMAVSWVGLIVAALLAIWGFASQFGASTDLGQPGAPMGARTPPGHRSVSGP